MNAQVLVRDRHVAIWLAGSSLLLSIAGAIAHAQDFHEGVEYVCNGEHIVAKCAPDDLSDNGHCSLENFTRKNLRGGTTLTSSKRGDVRKLFATCQPPGKQDLVDKARFDAQTKQMQDQAVAEQQQYRQRMQAQAHAAGGAGTTDPGTLAMRRCAAAGRDLTQCMGEVLGRSVQQVTGNSMPGMGKNLPPGLRMTGRYAAGSLGLTFSESQVLVACSGGAYTADYSVLRGGNGQIALTVTPDAPHQKSGIHPFRATVQPSGTLGLAGPVNAIVERTVGPAPGQSAQQTRHYLTPQELESSYSHRLNEVHRDEGGNLYVDMQPAMLHTAGMVTCNVSAVQPAGSSGNTSASQALGQAASIMGPLLSQGQGEQRGAQKPWPGPGLRLTGAYSSGPLRLEFHEESVSIGCGQIMDARSYNVQQAASGLEVRIDNQPLPILVSIRPDGTLNGSGPIQITGHTFVGDRPGVGSQYTSASSARCMLGTLTPGN